MDTGSKYRKKRRLFEMIREKEPRIYKNNIICRAFIKILLCPKEITHAIIAWFKLRSEKSIVNKHEYLLKEHNMSY